MNKAKRNKVLLGCFTRPWNDYGHLKVAIDSIAQAGYKIFGLMRHKNGLVLSGDSPKEEVEEIRKLIEKAGLKPWVAFSRINMDLPDDRAEAQYCRMLANIKAIGGRYSLIDGTEKPEHYERYKAIIRSAADHAAEIGMTIALKPHEGFCPTGAECLKIHKQINHKAFGLWYDPGNVLFYTQTNPSEDIKCVAPYVVGMCVKDYDRKKPGYDKVRINPGAGEVDFKSVLGTLYEVGFSGPLVVECVGGDTLEEVNKEARNTRAFLENILGEIGITVA